MSTMNERADERLTALEIKASWAEDLLDTLNALVARQQAQIEHLRRENALLRQQVPDHEGPALGSLRDELPPHY